MIRTLTVHGKGNVISTGIIYPPIKLDRQHQYSLGLVGLYTCNTVRNIFEGNNKFYYDTNKEITIDSGSYELDELNIYIQTRLAEEIPEIAPYDAFNLKANNNTLKCELQSVFQVDFSKPNSIGRMLGFGTRILEPHESHISHSDVDIISTSNIFIESNITSGAYKNNELCHSIFEFGLYVPPGYLLEKEPSHVIYFPLSVTEIDNITLRFVDYNNKLVNLSEDTYSSVRLELKRD